MHLTLNCFVDAVCLKKKNRKKARELGNDSEHLYNRRRHSGFRDIFVSGQHREKAQVTTGR